MSSVEFLRRLAVNSFGPGRFHAYCLLKHVEDYAPGPVDPDPTRSQIIMNTRSYGGAPPGAGVKSDLMVVFEEIQLAQETLENLKALVESMSRTNASEKKEQQLSSRMLTSKSGERDISKIDEEYLTSKEWIQKHGIQARKLELFDALSQVCFRHCDGVVDVKKEPSTGRVFFVGDGVYYFQGDAVSDLFDSFN